MGRWVRPLVFWGGNDAKEELRRQYGDKKMIQVEIEGYDQPVEFEDGTDPEVIQRKVKELVTGIDPRTGQKIGTITEETFTRGLMGAVKEEGPAVVGGIATGVAAAMAGPVTLPVMAGAVALGAAGGESMRQIGQHLSGSLGAPKTSIEAAKKIAAKGVEEGAWEVFGGLAMKGARKILAPFGKSVTKEAKEVTDVFKDKLRPIVLLPAEATESRTLDLLQNVAEASLIGGNRIADFKTNRTKFYNDFADSVIDQFGERTDPSDLGNLFVSAIEAKRATHAKVSGILYNNVQNAIDMGGGKSLAPTYDEGAKLLDSIVDEFGGKFDGKLYRVGSVKGKVTPFFSVNSTDAKAYEAGRGKVKEYVISKLGKVKVINLENDIHLAELEKLSGMDPSVRQIGEVLDIAVPKFRSKGYDSVIIEGNTGSYPSVQIEVAILNKSLIKPATDVGKGTRIYHGRVGRLSETSRMGDIGVHFTEDLDTAKELGTGEHLVHDFGARKAGPLPGGVVHSADIDPKKFLEIEDMVDWKVDDIKDALIEDITMALDNGVTSVFPKSSTSKIHNIKTKDDLWKFLKSEGYDGIKYVNKFEGPGHISYILNPKEAIKSVPRKAAGLTPESFAGAPAGVQVPTESLKSFIAPMRKIATDLGSIEAKNAGDDLISAIEDLPDTLTFDSARELRSRLIAKVDEFSVLNKKAPAIGKARKLIGLIDGVIEDSLKAFDGDRPETIVMAALKDKRTGKIGVGDTHVEALDGMDEGSDFIDGFMTSTGKFVNRDKALKIAKKSGQTPDDFKLLLGEDIDYGDIDLARGVGAYDAWRIANRFYKEGQKKFNNTMIRRLIKLAEDTGTGAEMIAPAIFRPGQVSKVRKAKMAMDPPTWRKMKGFFVQHLMQKSTDVDGVIKGKRLTNLISGKPNSFGLPMMKEILSDAQVKELQNMAKALELSQARQAEGAGKVLIQLSQAGAVGVMASGTLELPAATIIFGPALLSRMMLSPPVAKWLTKGITMPANSEVAAGILTRLMAAAYRIRNNMERERENEE